MTPVAILNFHDVTNYRVDYRKEFVMTSTIVRYTISNIISPETLRCSAKLLVQQIKINSWKKRFSKKTEHVAAVSRN